MRQTRNCSRKARIDRKDISYIFTLRTWRALRETNRLSNMGLIYAEPEESNPYDGRHNTDG